MTIVEIVLLCYTSILNIAFFWLLGVYFAGIKKRKEFTKYLCPKCNADKLEKITGYKYQSLDVDFLVVAAKLLEENDRLKEELDKLRVS